MTSSNFFEIHIFLLFLDFLINEAKSDFQKIFFPRYILIRRNALKIVKKNLLDHCPQTQEPTLGTTLCARRIAMLSAQSVVVRQECNHASLHDHVPGAQLESPGKIRILASYTWDLILILTPFHDYDSLTNG